jgi:predicted GH43/DUF377 family glycosyl hydrolase
MIGTSTSSRPAVSRVGQRLCPDPRRVIAKPFLPGEDPAAPESRVARLLRMICEMPDEQIDGLLAELRSDFADRHRDLDGILERSFEVVAGQLDDGLEPSKARRLVMGAYFTNEYAIEGAALFNPSIVPAPDQSGAGPGECRFVMSLRAVGEGHLSSIEFRTGTLDANGQPQVDDPTRLAEIGQRRSPLYSKASFIAKLAEFGALEAVTDLVIGPLKDRFSREELEESLAALQGSKWPEAIWYETARRIAWLANSNYEVTFPASTPLPQRVIFPESAHESRGMEDARFVRFVDDDGSVIYYATYTAFDGFNILPQLIETPDFTSFRIATLNGESAENKGMALFPRRIGGQFVALSRYDRQNIDVMLSDDVYTWNTRKRIRVPTHPWELAQMGNCGSPIETPEGWLVLTHGVGPFRRYSIGAMLLDLEDPHRVLAELPYPLLAANSEERDGYVPNVVYSCGAMVHNGTLVLPYGFSDAGASFATVAMDDLLARLTEHRVTGLTRFSPG